MSGLSYEMLKTVIGHLSTDTRIELYTHCSSIGNVERTTELRLDSLELRDNGFMMDGKSFHVYSLKDQGEPRRCRVNYYDYSGNGDRISRELDTPHDLVMKKLYNSYLGGRTTIKVGRLIVDSGFNKFLQVPHELKIDCKEVKMNGRRTKNFQFLREVLLFLTDSPVLERLTIKIDKTGDPQFQEKIVRDAKYLEIRKEDKLVSIPELTTLRNRHIHVATPQTIMKEDILRLAESWLATCPQLGTLFTLTVHFHYYFDEVREMMIKELGASSGTLKQLVRGEMVDGPCASFTMRNGLELNVYRNGRPQTSVGFLQMEVMTAGCFIPRTENNI